MNNNAITEAAELLRQAKQAVALTGAGLSTPSGIPDFRSQVGLWANVNPMEIASLQSFRQDPRRFYAWFRPLLRAIRASKPNPAHQALAALEQQGSLTAIISQNIDGLHYRAGSRRVFEMHGHLRSVTCTRCEANVQFQRVYETILRGELPTCSCGGLFRPDIILFDELLSQGLFWLAKNAVKQADAMLVAGISLEVHPVCELPEQIVWQGAPLIIVNKTPTNLDSRASVVIRGDVAEVLPAIVATLANQRRKARAASLPE